MFSVDTLDLHHKVVCVAVVYAPCDIGSRETCNFPWLFLNVEVSRYLGNQEWQAHWKVGLCREIRLWEPGIERQGCEWHGSCLCMLHLCWVGVCAELEYVLSSGALAVFSYKSHAKESSPSTCLNSGPRRVCVYGKHENGGVMRVLASQSMRSLNDVDCYIFTESKAWKASGYSIKTRMMTNKHD